MGGCNITVGEFDEEHLGTPLTVLEKKESKDKERQWIKGLGVKEEELTIIIKDRNVWNLIEVGKEYYVEISKDSEEPSYKLNEIKKWESKN